MPQPLTMISCVYPSARSRSDTTAAVRMAMFTMSMRVFNQMTARLLSQHTKKNLWPFFRSRPSSSSSSSSSSHLSRSLYEAMLMPVNSRSDDKLIIGGTSGDDEEMHTNIHVHSNGLNTTNGVNNEADSSPSHFRSNDEHLTKNKSDEAGNMVFAERQYFNKKNDEAHQVPSHSWRHRHFPRIISIEGDRNNLNNHLRREQDNKKPRIYVSPEGLKQQKRLLHSKDFSYRDPLYEGDCVPMQKWQETSFPNCNLFHELDFLGKSRTEEFKFMTQGGYNHIFWLNEDDKEDDPELVMKILKYGTLYTDRNYDRVRRDGLILERLTPSPYVLDTYGFCGFDVLTPYADGGTFGQRMSSWRRGKLKLSPKTRLKYAMEVASGLADVHDIDGEGMSSVAHGDLKGGQYLFLDGVIKLGDFNRGRFLRRNSTAPDTACPYTIGKNDAAFRSPEEYEYLPQTSAIDVWALGSILYEILIGKGVWHDTDTEKAQKNIREGKLPKIPDKYLNSEHPVDVALREAIRMCYIFDPKERAKAADVASYLRKKLSELTEE
mmetsp:Transcript_12175/g.26266  ORF Transcript_12175/g.26266 Transcript_12175/m.26266 type:complete len:548 (-) Transcript_12175:349-1992(-)